MERRVRRVIGFVLLGIVGIIEAIEWITVIHEYLPKEITDHLNQPTAIIVFVVGILMLFLGSGDEERDQAPIMSPVPAVKNEASPIINVNPTITSNVIMPPPPQSPLPVPIIAIPSRKLHNVKFVRVKEHQAPPDALVLLVAEYQNEPIPHTPVAPFNNVKARIDYKDYSTGKTIHTTYPAAWADRDEAEVYMAAGEPFFVALAMAENRKWHAVWVEEKNMYYGTIHDHHCDELPFGDLIAIVTLIGNHGLSIEPQRFHLRLEPPPGAGYARHLEPGAEA